MYPLFTRRRLQPKILLLDSIDVEIKDATHVSLAHSAPPSTSHKRPKPSTSNNTSHVLFVTCKKCLSQYIGETEQELHARQRGHLSDIKSNKDLPYVRHFRECGIQHYTITGVEKLRNRDPHVRKAREKYYKTLFDVQIK